MQIPAQFIVYSRTKGSNDPWLPAVKSFPSLAKAQGVSDESVQRHPGYEFKAGVEPERDTVIRQRIYDELPTEEARASFIRELNP